MQISLDYLSVTHRFVLLSNDVQCEVTNLFDVDGDEILADDESPEEATAAVVHLPSGLWLSIDLTMLRLPTLN
jgi:hypothetical protein